MRLHNILVWKLGAALCAQAQLRVDERKDKETIGFWDADIRSEPTPQEIAQWTAEYETSKDDIEADRQLSTKERNFLLGLLFEMNNEIRVLKGQNEIDRPTFMHAMRTRWKNA